MIFLAIALPFAAALYRFSVNYGYRGQNRDDAIGDAVLTGVLVACVVIVIAVWKWASQS